MRVCDLYRQTAQLGFEGSLENENRFYYAANRALLQVNSIRPAIASCIINHKPMVNLLGENTFSPIQRSSDLCFEAFGAKAYSFEADGEGIVYIETYDSSLREWRLIGDVTLSSPSRKFIRYYGFIKDGGRFISDAIRLRFSGEYLYSVKNVALWEHLYSDSSRDIPPCEPYTRYDMNLLVDDFLALDAPPIKEDEEYQRLNRDWHMEGRGIILLPYSSPGVFKIVYRRRPHEIVNESNAADNEARIDLDEELALLMPLLVAAYVWAEDEAELSQYYLALYHERAQEIERRARSLSPIAIKNPSGW